MLQSLTASDASLGLPLTALTGYTFGVMTIEQLRLVWKTQPFHPFDMHLADGRKVPVRHQEFLAMSPSGRTVIVYQPDDSFNIIDLLLVTDLEIKKNGKVRKKTRRSA